MLSNKYLILFGCFYLQGVIEGRGRNFTFLTGHIFLVEEEEAEDQGDGRTV